MEKSKILTFIIPTDELPTKEAIQTAIERLIKDYNIIKKLGSTFKKEGDPQHLIDISIFLETLAKKIKYSS